MKLVDPIGYARLIGTPEAFKDNNNINPTYRAQILVPGNLIKSAFVKDLTQRELGLELLIAALGKLLALPIPNSYLVLSDKVLPTSVGPTISTGERLLFASEDAMTPSLSRFASAAQSKQVAVLQALAKLQPIESLFALDTWIANIDRNAGNILVGPNGIWFIDHGQSLGGPAQDWSMLDPAIPFPQKLTVELAKIMAVSERQKVSDKCKAFPSDAKTVDFQKLIGAGLIQSVLGAKDFDLASNFLDKRKHYVPKLGSDVVGIGVIA